MTDFGCDYAILTVVPEAMAAARDLFGVTETTWENRLGRHFPVVLVNATDGGQHLVVLHVTEDRSNMPAQGAANVLLRAWKPRHLVVADIGGGFFGEDESDRDGLGLGDVVVASTISYYETIKEMLAGDQLRDNPIQLPAPGPRAGLLNLPDRVRDWHEPAASARPADGHEPPPVILSGEIVVGEKLLSNPSSDLVKALVKRYPKGLGLDMESAGVGRAAYELQSEGIMTQLSVIRGVSDLFDKIDTDNQVMRDDWKPYAARIAITTARAWITHEPTAEGVIARGLTVPDAALSAVALKAHHAARASPDAVYLDDLRKWIASLPPAPGQVFALALSATAHRTEGSVAPTEGEILDRGDVADLVMRDRRVVIYGPSGAGKTGLLLQVIRQMAAGEDPLLVYVDLKRGRETVRLDRLVENPDQTTVDTSINALLRASPQRPSVAKLCEWAFERHVVLMVDALNEVPAEAADRIRDALEEFVRRETRVSVLSTDRRVEVFYRDARWTALHLRGVTRTESGAIVDNRFGEGSYDRLDEHDQGILTVPFFLDRALALGKLDLGSRASAVREFLGAAGLSEDDISLTASVALGVYVREATVLDVGETKRLTDDALLDRLTAASVLVETADGGTLFGHQLFHQYLAGRHLATKPGLWTGKTLDLITSQAASLDAVAMTIATIETVDDRDRFLRIVYDWNWRAAVIALVEAQGSDHDVSPALAHAVLAMAAEKRFDPVLGTAERVEGQLKRVDDEIAKRMMELASVEELYSSIAEVDFPEVPWWSSWRDVFIRSDAQSALDDRALPMIGSAEPLIGWTIANNLRRFEPSPEALAGLKAIYRSQQRSEPGANATRWRVVHALGGWPTEESVDLLFEAFHDTYAWAVYGAVRSVVEIAARSGPGGLREHIVNELSGRWEGLHSLPLSQIAWTARYRDADPTWPDAIRALLRKITDGQSGAEAERWTRRLERFEEYAAEL